MPQDKESGARASQYGRDCGKRIIDAIGAVSVRAGSNECMLDGETLSVHCARKDTDRIGVTYKGLERVAAVLGAFESEDGSYVIWRMPKDRYESLMINTRSLGPSKNKVGMVKRVDFERHGIRYMTLPPFPSP